MREGNETGKGPGTFGGDDRPWRKFRTGFQGKARESIGGGRARITDRNRDKGSKSGREV